VGSNVGFGLVGVQEPMNVIDLVAIIPFYLSLLLEGLEDFEIIGKELIIKETV
jgi:hypothetical protein